MPASGGWFVVCCVLPVCCVMGQDPDTRPVRDPGIVDSATVSLHRVGSRPRSAAAADVDRDGSIDLVVANSGDGTITVLFGGADGIGGRAATYPAGPQPLDVRAADVDRDGDADIVAANHETDRVTVLLNEGTGVFSPAPWSPIATGARPHVHGVAVEDFDGDGWRDIMVESVDTREVRLVRGGREGFLPAEGIAVGTAPYYRVTAADLDGDGRPEALIPGQSDSSLRILRVGGGTSGPSMEIVRLGGKPWTAAAGDVNGDGRGDIAVVETDRVSVWIDTGRGYSEAEGSPHAIPGATDIALGDIDGDGRDDIAVGSWDGDEVTVIDGSGARRRIRLCDRPIGLTIADLDGDGRAEIAAPCATGDRVAVADGRSPGR